MVGKFFSGMKPRFVTCRQLQLFERLPAAARVERSSAFLGLELPVRLQLMRSLAEPGTMPESCRQLPSLQVRTRQPQRVMHTVVRA